MGERLFVGQSFDDAAFDQRLLDQLYDVTGLHLAVKGALGVDDHHGAHRAKAATPRLDHADLALKPAPRQLLAKRLQHRERTRCCATRPTTYQDIGPVYRFRHVTSSNMSGRLESVETLFQPVATLPDDQQPTR